MEAKEDMKIAGKMKARVETNVEAKLPAQLEPDGQEITKVV